MNLDAPMLNVVFSMNEIHNILCADKKYYNAATAQFQVEPFAKLRAVAGGFDRKFWREKARQDVFSPDSNICALTRQRKPGKIESIYRHKIRLLFTLRGRVSKSCVPRKNTLFLNERRETCSPASGEKREKA